MGMKKGVSATIIGIILFVVGMAIILSLVIYFSGTSNTQAEMMVHKMDIIRGGGII